MLNRPCRPHAHLRTALALPHRGARRLAALAALAALALLLASAPGQADDSMNADRDLIAGADSVEIAPQLRINGTHTRIREFVIEQPIATVLARYRTLLGQRHVENQLGAAVVLARRDGDTLLVIRLMPRGAARTAGTVSRANLAAVRARHHGAADFRPPPGSVLTTDLEMRDPGKDARFLAWHNRWSIERNAEYLARELSSRGYRADHDPDSAPDRAPAAAPGSGRSLWFSGDGSDAVAILLPGVTGTTVTLNLVRHRTGVTP